jgi:hypothetical protein
MMRVCEMKVKYFDSLCITFFHLRSQFAISEAPFSSSPIQRNPINIAATPQVEKNQLSALTFSWIPPI